MENKKQKTKKKTIKKIVKFLSVIMFILIIILLVLGIKKINSESKEDKVINYDNKIEESENNELYSEETKAFEIKTSYCDLYYPEEWKDIVRTESVLKEGVEEVQFWAKLEGKEEVHLFDIVFGGEEYEVGNIETEEGKNVTVNVVSHEFDDDDSWTEDEKNKIYSMMEDINYILLQLEEVEGYTSMF